MRRGHQQSRARVIQLEGSFFGGVERVHQSVNAAEHGYRVKGDAVLGTICAEDSKDIAFAEAFLGQTGRRAPHRVLELTISQSAAARPVDERRLVLEFTRCLKNEVGD